MSVGPYRTQSTLLAALVLSVGPFRPSPAQASDGRFELGLYGGNVTARGGTSVVLDARRRREITTRIDDGVSAGLRVAIFFTRQAAVEAAFGGSTNRHLASLEDRGQSLSVNDTKQLIFAYGGPLWHIIEGRVVPYLAAGLGIIGFVGPKSSFAFNYGGGLKLFVTPRLALRIDARRHHTDLHDSLDEAGVDRQGQLILVPNPFQDKLRLLELSGGMSYRFK